METLRFFSSCFRGSSAASERLLGQPACGDVAAGAGRRAWASGRICTAPADVQAGICKSGRDRAATAASHHSYRSYMYTFLQVGLAWPVPMRRCG